MRRIPVPCCISLMFLMSMTLLGCSGDKGATQVQPTTQHYGFPNLVHSDGQWIRDSFNRTVILRGINVGSRSKLPPFLPFEDTSYLDQLVDWGLNSIRLLFTWEGVEPEQGTYDESYLERLHTILDACTQRQLVVILDSHQDLYSRNFCGDGFPGWAVHPDYREQTCPGPSRMWPLSYVLSPGVVHSFNRFWQSPELKSAYIQMMVHVADRLGSSPALIGIDLLNEPFDLSYFLMNGTFERDTLTPFYRELIASIRERLPDLMISYGTTGPFSVGFPTFLEPIGLPNVVFGAHWYDLISLVSGAGSDLTSLRERLQGIMDMASGWSAPVWIGEYGVPTNRSDNLAYLSGQIDLLEEFLVGSAIWTYNPTDVDWNGENTSLVYPGGGETPHVNILVRPYPARIAGTPTHFRFDRETGTFELTFRAESSATGPTEIVVPVRNYPAGFDVEAEDGQWSWDAGQRRIYYHTTQDRALHTIRVLPRS